MNPWNKIGGMLIEHPPLPSQVESWAEQQWMEKNALLRIFVIC